MLTTTTSRLVTEHTKIIWTERKDEDEELGYSIARRPGMNRRLTTHSIHVKIQLLLIAKRLYK